MSKRPAKQYTPEIKKPNLRQPPDGFMKRNPVWAFSKCVKKNQRWTIFCQDFYENGIPKMIDFEGMTWGEITRQTHDKSHKSSNHYIGLDKLTPQGKQNFPNYCASDNLFSLRIDNVRRLIGFLEDGTFYILWYDQHHEVVSTAKKHT